MNAVSLKRLWGWGRGLWPSSPTHVAGGVAVTGALALGSLVMYSRWLASRFAQKGGKNAVTEFVNPNHVRKQHAYCLHVLQSTTYLLGVALAALERAEPTHPKLAVMRQVFEQNRQQLEDEVAALPMDLAGLIQQAQSHMLRTPEADTHGGL